MSLLSTSTKKLSVDASPPNIEDIHAIEKEETFCFAATHHTYSIPVTEPESEQTHQDYRGFKGQ
jgi:hypothetical protein